MKEFLKTKSTSEVMILLFTAAVVLAILAGGLTLAIMEFRSPDLDNTKVEEHLFNLLSTILGALLGLLTGNALSNRKHEIEEHNEH